MESRNGLHDSSCLFAVLARDTKNLFVMATMARLEGAFSAETRCQCRECGVNLSVVRREAQRRMSNVRVDAVHRPYAQVRELVRSVLRQHPYLRAAPFTIRDVEGPVRYDSSWVPGGRGQVLRQGP